MFNDTLKSFPLTFFCFYSVTHCFPIFRCFKVCICCLLLQCSVWLAAKSKVCFASHSYHSINFVELSNSLLGLVWFALCLHHLIDCLSCLFEWLLFIRSAGAFEPFFSLFECCLNLFKIWIIYYFFEFFTERADI